MTLMKQRDILSKKLAELDKCNTQFDAAVSMITGTITKLSSINSSIDEKVKEIEDYREQLANARTGLLSAKTRNDGIIRNFSALLEQ